MGNVSDRATLIPQGIEWLLPWGQIIRGFRWGKGPDTVLLLHEPGLDLESWTTLPVEIARQLEIETIAADLPGAGTVHQGLTAKNLTLAGAGRRGRRGRTASGLASLPP